LGIGVLDVADFGIGFMFFLIFVPYMEKVERRWREIIRIRRQNGVKVEGKINPGRQLHISKTVSMPGPAFYSRKGATSLKIRKRMSSKEKKTLIEGQIRHFAR